MNTWKTLGQIIIIAGLLAMVSSAKADPHSRGGITNITETNITEEQAGGVALAIALGQHQFDWSTDKWQGSASAANFDDESAGSVALAKRFNGFLFSGSAGRVHGENAYGVSTGWRW